ncbi:MAG: peptidoglycan editing factor PgeF [Aestuariibacter sp.]
MSGKGLQLVTPKWSAPETVRAFSTTRFGGESLPPYDSLNLGLHVGDDPQHVRGNRQKLPLPAQPTWLQQVHGKYVVELNHNDSCTLIADASYSSTPGVVCAIMTADCLPILLCNKQGTFVAAIHAGWRGLQQGIIASTVARYRGDVSELMLWVGPGISQDKFEVGEDVKKAFPSFSEAFITATTPDKYFADLPAIASQQAQNCGIEHVSTAQLCTFSQPERFFSYRRDGKTGRMGTFIWIVK